MTARKFLNQHLGHSATVEWGEGYTSQQRVEFYQGGGAIRSTRYSPPNMHKGATDLSGPVITFDRIRAVYCCGEHWSAE